MITPEDLRRLAGYYHEVSRERFALTAAADEIERLRGRVFRLTAILAEGVGAQKYVRHGNPCSCWICEGRIVLTEKGGTG